LGNRDENSPFEQIGQNLDRLSSSGFPPLAGKSKKSKPKKQPKTKGFGSMDDSGANGSKKKKSSKKR